MTMETKVIVGADINSMKAQFSAAAREAVEFGGKIKNVFTSIRDSLGNIGNLIAGYGALKLVNVADEAALLSARLKDVTGSAAGAAEAQAKLFNIAQHLQVGYKDLTGSFARMLPAVKAIGGGTAEAAKLAEILAVTARLSGASSAEAASSAVQFAQALGSGVLQGDELRSILENNQALARTLAGALGVTVGELKKLGAEGKLTADVIANALLGQYDTIKQRSAELPNTVGGAWTRIENEFTKFVQSVNEGTSVFSGIAELLNEIARLLAAVTVSFRDTRTEAKKLGDDKSAITWARTIVEAFAGIVDLARLVKQAFVSVGRDIGAVAAAIVRAAQGDFSGAFAILKERSQDLQTEAKRMKDLWMGTGDSLLGSLRNQAAPGSAATGGSSAKLKSKAKAEDDSKKKKAAAEPSFMQYYEAALDEEKRFQSEQDALREYSKQQELAYWQHILQYARLSTQDRLAIVRKVGDLEIDIRREGMQRVRELDAEMARGKAERDIGAVQTARAANQLMLDAEKITKQQYVARELEFQAQIYNIQAQAIRERIRLAESDPSTSPAEKARLNNDLLALEQKFQQDRTQIVGQLYKKDDGGRTAEFFNGMANSFSSSLEYMMTRARNWKDAMRTLWNGMASVFIRVLVTEPLGAWVAAQARMLAAKLGFVQASAGMDAASSATTIATKTTEASAVIGAEGAKAGAGAAASQASIPIVGPALAIAAMVATLAAVLALRKNLKSAAGGYDIPSGINPMAQLHEEEMVLPKGLANKVRKMTDEPGQESRGGGDTFVIQAWDSKDVKRFLERHGPALLGASKRQRRNFAV